MAGDKVNANVAFTEPAGIITERGRVTPVLVDRRATIDGFADAAVKVTPHTPLWPGAKVTGAQVEGEVLDGPTLEPLEGDLGLTIQVVEAAVARVVPAHCREESAVGAAVIVRVTV
jgi:hypothetical protein